MHHSPSALRVLFVAGWLAFAGVFGAAPAAGQWTYHGLSGGMLRELRLHEGALYAATDHGLYRKAADTTDTTWTPLGFAGRHVRTFAFLGADTMLAAVHLYTDGQAQDQQVYRTADGGTTWVEVATHVERDDPEELFKVMRRAPAPPHTLFAGGFHGIWTSTDHGSTWTRAAPASDVHFLAFDPLQPDVVWSGGESNILWPYLLKSTDGGATWRWMQLDLGGDNAVYTLAIDPLDPDVLYAGTEGAVLKSTDGGASWQTVLYPDTHEYFLGLAIGPGRPARLYAAGIRNTNLPQRPTLYVSNDHGASWSGVGHGESRAYFGVVSMAVRGGAGVDTVYLGTQHDGVFAYTAPAGTGSNPDHTVPVGYRLDQNFPNPFTSSTTIRFVTGTTGHVRLAVFDVLGREVGRPVDGPLAAGAHHVDWRAEGRPGGTYFYRLEVGPFTTTRRMVLAR